METCGKHLLPCYKTLVSESVGSFLCAVWAVLLILIPGAAYAQLDTLICGVNTWAQGDIGRAAATAAIVVVGYLTVLQRISWGMAAITIAALAITFNSQAIALALFNFSAC